VSDPDDTPTGDQGSPAAQAGGTAPPAPGANRTRFATPGGRSRFSAPPAPPAPPTTAEPSVTPAPTEPLVTPAPTEPLVTPAPTEPLVTPAPTEPSATPAGAEPVAAAAERVGGSRRIEPDRAERSGRGERAGRAERAEQVQSRGTSPRLILAGLGALAVVLVVLVAFLAQTLSRSGNQEDRRQEALDASRDNVRAILAYDYRHLDQDYAAARAVITGPLRKEYDTTAATKKMSQDRVALKASLSSEVLNAAIETSDADRATALVFVNRSVRGSVFATPQVTLDRIEMTMVRQHGTWLVEKLQMR